VQRNIHASAHRVKGPWRASSRRSTKIHILHLSKKYLTPQYELDIVTPQNESAPRRPISKISIQNFEKLENLNSRIWKIVVQGIHIAKYLGIYNTTREWQTFQIQIGRLGADSFCGVKYEKWTLETKGTPTVVYVLRR